MDDLPAFAEVDAAAGFAPPLSNAQQAAILRAMVLSLPDGIAFADPDGTTRLTNDVYLANLDMDRAEFRRLRTVEARFQRLFETGRLALTHDTVENSVHAALERRARADGTPIIRQQGQDRWVDWRVIALPEGRKMLLNRDITELKQIEISLRERTSALKEALDFQIGTSDILKVISRSAFDRDALLNTVATSAASLCGADSVIIYRYQDGAYRFAAGGNVRPEYEQVERQLRIVPGRETLIGRAALEKRPVQIVDGLSDPEYADKETLRLANVRTMLGVPLVRDGMPVGAMALARSTVQPFTERQIELVTTFADRAAIAIENARLFDALKHREQELQQARDAAERDRALMQAMLDNMTDGVALVEAYGTIVLWNDAINEINGFPAGVFGGFGNIAAAFRWQFEHGHLTRTEATLELDVAALMVRFREGDAHTMTLRRPNGNWVEVRWRTLPDGRRLVTNRNVTALKQRELELEASRAEIERAHGVTQTVLDNVTDGLALFDGDGQVVLLNRAFHAINNLPPNMFERDKDVRIGLRWQLEHG